MAAAARARAVAGSHPSAAPPPVAAAAKVVAAAGAERPFPAAAAEAEPAAEGSPQLAGSPPPLLEDSDTSTQSSDTGWGSDDEEHDRRPATSDEEAAGPLCSELQEMGFAPVACRAAAARHGTLQQCVDWLLEHGSAVGNGAAAAVVLPTVDCSVCFTAAGMPSQRRMSCAARHWVCRSCLTEYLTLLITEKRVMDSELVCPCGCEDGPIDHSLVRDSVPEEIYQRFLDVRLEKEWARTHPDEVVHCPGCEWMCIADKSDGKARVKCESCKLVFCGLCGALPHRGMSCSEVAQQKLRSDPSIVAFRAMMVQQGLQRCPGCGNAAEQSRGCKFMYCTCGARFCLHCGRPLGREQHYSHFPDGPYGTRCFGGKVDGSGHQALPKCADCPGWSGGRTDCAKCADWQGCGAPRLSVAAFPGDPRGLCMQERGELLQRVKQLKRQLHEQCKKIQEQTGKPPSTGAEYGEGEADYHAYFELRDQVRVFQSPIDLPTTPEEYKALSPAAALGLRSELKLLKRRMNSRPPAEVTPDERRRYRQIRKAIQGSERPHERTERPQPAAGAHRHKHEALFPGDPRALPPDAVKRLRAEHSELRRALNQFRRSCQSEHSRDPHRQEYIAACPGYHRYFQVRDLLRVRHAPAQLPAGPDAVRALTQAQIEGLRAEHRMLKQAVPGGAPAAAAAAAALKQAAQSPKGDKEDPQPAERLARARAIKELLKGRPPDG
eukprot:TRINITY_DN16220_c0_g5_i1.p1 TRINITY_DN16220_c0_g5~~TRINITY_DN16220_c0_g5_i1.p1  ORF type:complete len:751 (+),score=215.55 TRINITY_DN16220_c0_g5_i1:96-2255(+)